MASWKRESEQYTKSAKPTGFISNDLLICSAIMHTQIYAESNLISYTSSCTDMALSKLISLEKRL